DGLRGGVVSDDAQRLARAVRNIPLPPEEVAAARERVHVRLLAAIANEGALRGNRRTDTRAPLRPHSASWDADAYSSCSSPRRLSLCAALLLFFSPAGVCPWLASSPALPSSPLYGLKRAQEWVALQTAWSDQRRGDVLLMIASHRLDEAKAESNAGHD